MSHDHHDQHPVFKLPERIVHDHLRVMDADLRPWSIDLRGIRQLGKNRGAGVRVGVIDTGYADHFDLEDAVKSQVDFTGSRWGSVDKLGHGTHVLGTIAGRETDRGGVGLAPACELHVAKGLGDDGTGSDAQIAKAILHLTRVPKVHLINLSLGAPSPLPQTGAAVQEATAAGITIVCASGNFGDSARSWPAMDERCLSIGATDIDDKPAAFSERSSVDCAAPGVKIQSCYLNGQYALLSGTSMSAPWFTGFLAIYFGHLLEKGEPLPSPKQVYSMLNQWAVDIGAVGHDDKTGHGLISAERYLKAIEDRTPPPDTKPKPPADEDWEEYPDVRVVAYRRKVK